MFYCIAADNWTHIDDAIVSIIPVAMMAIEVDLNARVSGVRKNGSRGSGRSAFGTDVDADLAAAFAAARA